MRQLLRTNLLFDVTSVSMKASIQLKREDSGDMTNVKIPHYSI